MGSSQLLGAMICHEGFAVLGDHAAKLGDIGSINGHG
jgi:hypothetical protein